MAKRFFDSQKFDDPWYRKLLPYQKCFWEFLLCKCDHAGFWKVDFEAASWHIGQEIKETDMIDILNGRVVVLKNDLWFIPKFITFQYGKLNSDVKVHKSVMDILSKNRINSENLTVSKQLDNSFLTVQDKDKDKDKDKDSTTRFDFESLWSKYPNKDGKKVAERHFKASVKNEKDYKDIQTALENYIKSDSVAQGFIKNGSTWFNNWRDWITPPKKGFKDGLPESLKHLA